MSALAAGRATASTSARPNLAPAFDLAIRAPGQIQNAPFDLRPGAVMLAFRQHAPLEIPLQLGQLIPVDQQFLVLARRGPGPAQQRRYQDHQDQDRERTGGSEETGHPEAGSSGSGDVSNPLGPRRVRPPTALV